jgi:Tol biopolymer transport system component
VCVIFEQSQNGNRAVLTAFDPIKGRGRVLRTVEKEPSAAFSGWSLSPDGRIYAILEQKGSGSLIRLLSLTDASDREITLNAGPNTVQGLDWSPDGSGFYTGALAPQRMGCMILHIDLNGNTRVVWRHKGETSGTWVWAIPSPDGRYLAIRDDVFNSDAWMINGF